MKVFGVCDMHMHGNMREAHARTHARNTCAVSSAFSNQVQCIPGSQSVRVAGVLSGKPRDLGSTAQNVCAYEVNALLGSLRRMSMSIVRPSQPALNFYRNFNCWRAAITKPHRQAYVRTYPSLLVLPDGSSINIQYHEPRKIIVLPIDVSTLSQAEYAKVLTRRIPKMKQKKVEEIEDTFDESRYFQYTKTQ